MSELQIVNRLYVCVVMPVNQAKLQKLLQQGDKARIGGKVRCEVGGGVVCCVNSWVGALRVLQEERRKWFIKVQQMTKSFKLAGLVNLTGSCVECLFVRVR